MKLMAEHTSKDLKRVAGVYIETTDGKSLNTRGSPREYTVVLRNENDAPTFHNFTIMTEAEKLAEDWVHEND